MFKKMLKENIELSEWNHGVGQKELNQGDNMETKLKNYSFYPMITSKTTTVIVSFKKQIVILGKGTQKISKSWEDCIVLVKP